MNSPLLSTAESISNKVDNVPSLSSKSKQISKQNFLKNMLIGKKSIKELAKEFDLSKYEAHKIWYKFKMLHNITSRKKRIQEKNPIPQTEVYHNKEISLEADTKLEKYPISQMSLTPSQPIQPVPINATNSSQSGKILLQAFQQQYVQQLFQQQYLNFISKQISMEMAANQQFYQQNRLNCLMNNNTSQFIH